MLKELNFCGIYFAPLILRIAIAAIVFVPLHHCGDRLEIQRFVWNRPLCEAGLFVIVLSLVTFLL